MERSTFMVDRRGLTVLVILSPFAVTKSRAG